LNSGIAHGAQRQNLSIEVMDASVEPNGWSINGSLEGGVEFAAPDAETRSARSPWPSPDFAEVRLRPNWIERLVGAPFLTVFLVGWFFGELLTGGLLLTCIVGLVAPGAVRAPPAPWTTATFMPALLAVVFLTFFFPLWTVRGLAALFRLARCSGTRTSSGSLQTQSR
jgi:hypothetical protein